MVQVILAGYNIEKGVLDALVCAFQELKQAASRDSEPDMAVISAVSLDALTPEIFSAAYAHISRDPRSVNLLRVEATHEVDKARKSNTAIIFGLGHESVAEHAVFNYDVLGISRLAVEEVEARRLASYTEKSQRYITLNSDVVIPDELLDLNLEGRIHTLADRAFSLYQKAYERAVPFMVDKYQSLNGVIMTDKATREEKKTTEGWAKEDARYIASLMTVVQLGMTVNARNIEKIVRNSRHHPLAEIRDYGRQLGNRTASIAPSLVPLINPELYQQNYGRPVEEDYLADAQKSLADANAQLMADISQQLVLPFGKDLGKGLRLSRHDLVQLVSSDPRGEARVIAALLMKTENIDETHAMVNAESALRNPSSAKKYMMTLFRSLGKHDILPRAFERATLDYDIVMSASAFAQMKRHRMITLLPSAYNPHLGLTIPDSIKAIGMEQAYKDIMDETSELFYSIQEQNPDAAAYVLTNAHRRRVVIHVNVRELYAISRLREDKHAQWDIRAIATSMIEQARQVYPTLMMYACGKDRYDQEHPRSSQSTPAQ